MRWPETRASEVVNRHSTGRLLMAQINEVVVEIGLQENKSSTLWK